MLTMAVVSNWLANKDPSQLWHQSANPHKPGVAEAGRQKQLLQVRRSEGGGDSTGELPVGTGSSATVTRRDARRALCNGEVTKHPITELIQFCTGGRFEGGGAKAGELSELTGSTDAETRRVA